MNNLINRLIKRHKKVNPTVKERFANIVSSIALNERAKLDEAFSSYKVTCQNDLIELLTIEYYENHAKWLLDCDDIKLFKMARYNENKNSIDVIEYRFDIKLPKTQRARLPVLTELALKNNIDF